jgi:hypothetical protein
MKPTRSSLLHYLYNCDGDGDIREPFSPLFYGLMHTQVQNGSAARFSILRSTYKGDKGCITKEKPK